MFNIPIAQINIYIWSHIYDQMRFTIIYANPKNKIKIHLVKTFNLYLNKERIDTSYFSSVFN